MFSRILARPSVDHRPDVASVAIPKAVLDLLVQLVELAPDRLDLLGGQAPERVLRLLEPDVSVCLVAFMGCGRHCSPCR